jgi:phosphoribosylamine--glycine ligase
VRTADFAVCDDVASAQTFIDARIADGRGVVVKADGLCAGKGVTVCRDAHDALDIVTDMLGVHGAPRFGDASCVVVLEDLLPGVELSAFALCDGTDCVVLPLARDHKRLLDDDLGPNTGGMGAVAPLDARHGVPAAASRERLHSDVFVPVLREMAKRGVPFRGVLFAGLMVHDDVVSVLEFNVRFGDPETQALMVGMRADFVPTLQAIARGEPLPESASSLTSCAPTAVVVLAAHGYPDSPRAGDVITGLDETPAGAHVFCAGVRAKGGTLITSGGRVLSVTSSGDTFADALAHAYAAVDTVQFSGAQVRRDIGRSVREA